MRWSQLKTRVEALIVPALQGRVQLYITSYNREDVVIGRGWVTVDGEEVLSISSENRQDFYEAVRAYPDTAIDGALASSSELTRGLAMVDRRLGKRRLQALDVSAEHPFVQCLHKLRCEVEGIVKE